MGGGIVLTFHVNLSAWEAIHIYEMTTYFL